MSLVSRLKNIALFGYLISTGGAYCQITTEHMNNCANLLSQLEAKYVNLQNKLICEGELHELTFIYNNKWVTYGVVNINGKYWLDRNLGAKRAAFNMDDVDSYGDYFQWGRGNDGHQLLDTITSNKVLLPQTQPKHNYFIRTDINSDWTVDTKWGYRWRNSSGIKTSADVCPIGWHVPTIKEWSEIAFVFKNDTMLFESKLKLVKAGCNKSRSSNTQGYGFYWSCNFDIQMSKIRGRAFYFNRNLSDAWKFSEPPMRGFPIRCTMDTDK